MRVIDIPKPREIEVEHAVMNDGTVMLLSKAMKKKWEFFDWLKIALNTHQKLGKGFEGIELSMRLTAALKAKKNGVLSLDEDLFKVVYAAVDGCAYNPTLAMQIPEFWLAVKDAQEVEAAGEKPKGKGKSKK